MTASATGWRRFQASGLLLLCVFLAHSTSLRTSYVYDDVEAILEHPDLRDVSNIGTLFLTSYWRAEREIGLYRPLVQVSYLIDGAGFGFESPLASHLISLLVHLGCVGLLFGLLGDLGFGLGIRWVAALWFGVHPALLDAVVWISGRTDLLCALFCLAALRAAIAASRRDCSWRSLGAWWPGLLWLAGLLSKEMAGPLPLLILCLPAVRWKPFVPGFVLALAIYVFLRANAVDDFLPAYVSDAGVVLQDRGLITRVLIAAQALGRLLLLLPLPVGLAADHRAHEYASSDALAGPLGFLALGIYIHFVVSALLGRRRAPGTAFLLLAAVFSLLPILQIVPIGAVMAERFLYLPAAFVLPLLALLVMRIPQWQLRRLVFSVAIGAAVVLTLVRTPVYSSGLTYFQDVVRAYPDDHRAWHNLGVAHYRPLEGHEHHQPDHAAADRAFARALEVKRSYRLAWINRARARLDRGGLEGLEELEDWLAPYANRKDGDALYLLGKVALREGRALSSEDRRRKPALAAAEDRYLGAAEAFLAAQKRERAAVAYKEAGIAARESGDRARKQAHWRRALELNPQINGGAAMRKALD